MTQALPGNFNCNMCLIGVGRWQSLGHILKWQYLPCKWTGRQKTVSKTAERSRKMRTETGAVNVATGTLWVTGTWTASGKVWGQCWEANPDFNEWRIGWKRRKLRQWLVITLLRNIRKRLRWELKNDCGGFREEWENTRALHKFLGGVQEATGREKCRM